MERRIDERRPLRVLLNAFQRGVPVICAAEDISTSGIRLRTVLNGRRLSDDRLHMEFQLPDDSAVINAVGVAVRSTRDDTILGIRFTHLSTEASASIQAYVEGRSAMRASA